MADRTMSLAARRLNAGRWGPAKPIRVARELELRIDELPATERVRLATAWAKAQQEQEQWIA